MNDAAPAAAAVETDAPPPFPSILGAADWTDRVNPIVVRETIQAVSGRGFFAVLVVAVIGAGVTALVTLSNVRTGRNYEPLGDVAFYAFIQFIVLPIAAIVLPFQAFATMRTEMQAGVSEQLFLSGLSPRKVVFGRMTATIGQFLLWTFVFLPLLATTYVLRGVSVAEMCVGVVFTGFVCVLHSAFATAAGAFTRWKVMSAFANAMAGVGVAAAAISWIAVSRDLVQDSAQEIGGRHGGLFVAIAVLLFGGGAALLLLVAQSQLTHPFENRSTPFRVFFVAVVLASVGAAEWAYFEFGGREARVWPYLAAFVAGLPFLLFPMTEDEGLSPAVRTRVPKNPVLALLLAPLLPGRGLGMIFVALVSAAMVVANDVIREPKTPSWDIFYESTFAPPIIAAYVVIYGGAACLLRPLFRRGTAGNWIARAIILVGLILACVGPVLYRVLTESFYVWKWTWIDLLNPFVTMEKVIEPLAQGETSPIAATLAGVAGGVLVATVPAMVRGVAEVLRASAARREADRIVIVDEPHPAHSP